MAHSSYPKGFRRATAGTCHELPGLWLQTSRGLCRCTVTIVLMQARFIPPMLLLRKEALPQGPEWLYESKLDGYRALGIKSGGKVQLRSRNDNDFSARYSDIARALMAMSD